MIFRRENRERNKFIVGNGQCFVDAEAIVTMRSLKANIKRNVEEFRPVMSDADWKLVKRKLQFTDRELEVIRGVMSEQTDEAIAGTLGMTTRTVRAHLDSLYRKCGCRTRTGAVVYVFRTVRHCDVAH